MFWELEKAIFGPEKDKWWIWGSKTPKPPEMTIKLGQKSQHHNWPHYMDWHQIGPKIAIKQGNNTKRTNGTHFARPPPPSPTFKLQNVQFDPFRSVSVEFGPFRAASGESWGVGWGWGGSGFCKRKDQAV